MSSRRRCGRLPARAFLVCSFTGLAGCAGDPAMSAAPPVERPCPVASVAGTDATIRWHYPRSPDDNAHLLVWCRTVGPVVFEARPVGQFPPMTAGDESLEVVSWNANAGAGDLVGLLETELGVVCRGADSVLRPGARPFVLLLQEALRRSSAIPDVPDSPIVPDEVGLPEGVSPRPDVVESAAACGLSLFYVAAARDGHRTRAGRRQDKGNAILSTLPLRGPEAIELPFESSRRVVPVASMVDTGGADLLRVASVHLVTTPGPWRIVWTGNSAHARQARALDGVLRPGSSPDLVAGDFNSWAAGEQALRLMREAFPESPRALAQATRPPFVTDHVFFRAGEGDGLRIDGESYRRVEDRYGSDHHPVTVRLQRDR